MTATNTANLSSSASTLVHVMLATSQSPTIAIADPPDGMLFPYVVRQPRVGREPAGRDGDADQHPLSRDPADVNRGEYTQHTITAIATDSGGQTAVATITVRGGILIN